MYEPLRIVHLEDNPMDAELVAIELERSGLNVVIERIDTETAFIASLASTPDLVLADFSLPTFDGLSALSRLRELGMRTPFILVSGAIGEELAVQAVRMGADDYILKDRMARLGEAVNQALARRSLQVQSEASEAARGEAEQRVIERNEELAALSVRLLQVQEEEQRRLASELHDEIGSQLTGARLLLASIHLPTAENASALKGIAAILDELTGQISSIILDLRPPMLDDSGLLEALLAHFERFTSQTGIEVEFQQTGLNTRFSRDVESTGFRVIQESLTNVARYAGVDKVTVGAGVEGDVLRIYVVDNGRGFQSSAVPGSTGVGLRGMRERVELLHGNLVIESPMGRGIRISVSLPIKAEPTIGPRE